MNTSENLLDAKNAIGYPIIYDVIEVEITQSVLHSLMDVTTSIAKTKLGR